MVVDSLKHDFNNVMMLSALNHSMYVGNGGELRSVTTLWDDVTILNLCIAHCEGSSCNVVMLPICLRALRHSFQERKKKEEKGILFPPRSERLLKASKIPL